MRVASLVFSTENGSSQRNKAAWVIVWLVLVLLLSARHVFWRDEVRALSFALQGDNVLAMLHSLHGEGHPALWYLLLRGANALLPTPAVLPVVSILVALAAVVLLARRSPFSWPLVAVFLLGRPALFEYSVMARNYGISMLLMFAFAALYPRHRDRGVVLGVVLLLLANCNAHSAIMAGVFGLFWLLDLRWGQQDLRPGALRNLWLNAAIAAFGVVLCAATVYPTFNDAAQRDASSVPIATMVKALVLPARAALEPLSLWPTPYDIVPLLLMQVLLFGGMLGLAFRPAALVAALTALLGLSVSFAFISGSYRHHALWLLFLVSMYWIAGADEPRPAASPVRRKLRTLGLVLFSLLLVLQIPIGLLRAGQTALASAPESRSRDLALLVAGHPELKDAIVIGDPDFLLEPLSQYMPNRTYLLRERRFGKIVFFTHKARLTLGLDEILADAQRLREITHQPVVILLTERLDPAAPARTIPEGYNWKLVTTPEQVRAFLSATRLIERFGPACCTDESFDVYVLDR